VLTLEPRHFGALRGLGLILEESGDLKGALGAYRAALAIHPFRPDLREAADRLEAGLQGMSI
jgi:Flp pilus assembly protein TadD